MRIITLMIFLCFSLSGHADHLRLALEKSMALLDDRIVVGEVRPAPLDGIVEVEVGRGEFAYATEDGKYIFWGQLVEVHETGYLNLTEQRIEKHRRVFLDGLDSSTFISFPATNIEVASAYVFTDISCGYCRKFHEEIKEMNDAGITIHYLAFPRAGSSSDVGRALAKIWCSENPNTALTEAKAQGKIPEELAALCVSPVVNHVAVGGQLNLSGTPAIYTPDGRQIGGYLTAEEMIKTLIN